VQIGCVRHWRGHSRITVMIGGSAFQGLFEAQLRAFATTLLNGPHKSKEMEKEMASQELGKG